MFARPFGQRVEFTSSMVCLAALALTIGLVAASQPGGLPQIGGTDASAGEGVVEGYGELPLAFEENRGQTDGRVDFLARASGQTAFLTSTGATLALQPDGGRAEGAAVRLDLIGADPAARPTGLDRLPGEVNVLRGDPRGSTTGIATFERVRYADVYPGVDVAWYGTQAGQLEFDFVVAPGADPGAIGMELDGARQVSLSDTGALRINTPAGTLVQRPPVAYQQVDGHRAQVSSRYELSGDRVRVAVGAYDRERPLVIDPVLVYSTFLGDTATDRGNGIAVDASGNTYVTGLTTSSAFPTTTGAFDTSPTVGQDAFVSKLNASGSALAYSTFLGGASNEEARGIAVDASGSAYVTGSTTSSDFPTTAGAFDTSLGIGDAFVSKLNASGSALVYSTFLGGSLSEVGNGIAVDASGSAYVTGNTTSSNLTTTAGAFDTSYNGGDFGDAFVAKLDSSGSDLAYSTYLGGTSTDRGNGVAVDASGSAYVAATAGSSSFPTTAGAFDTSHNGGDDAALTKLDASGATLGYSTFLGGASGEAGTGIAIDASDSAYVTGLTASSDFPTTPGAFDTSLGGTDAFVAKVDSSGSGVDYSTYLGGAMAEVGRGIAVDASGSAQITGETQSPDFPTTAGAFDTTHNGGQDPFITGLDASGSALAYSTFLGGTAADRANAIAVDASGSAYVTGDTQSGDFPTTPGAFDTSYANADLFVVKYGTAPPNPDTDGDGIFDSVDPDPGTPSSDFDDGDGTSGSVADPAGLAVTIEDLPDPDGVRVVVGPGTGKATLSVCGFTVKVSAGGEVELTCGSVTLDVIEGEAEVELDGGAAVVSVPAGVRATVTENPDGSFTVENHGGGDVTVTIDGVESTVGPGESTEVRTWHFVGFTSPVDNPPVLNIANAGQAIPLKWRLLDTSGAPVTNLTSAHITATSLACSLGSTADLLEESAPGSSGLQNLGNGYYQLNWKTPKGYAKSCKTLHLDLGEGITRDAYFQFRK